MGVRRALVVSVLLAGLAPIARAQCANLGTPGTTGCPPISSPTLSCVGPPAAGNLAFKLATNIAAPLPAALLAGICASPPYPVAASYLCPFLSVPCATTGFVNLAAFFAVSGVTPGFLQPIEFPFPIEGDPALVGFTLCAQAIALSPNGPCVMVTNGLSIVIQ